MGTLTSSNNCGSSCQHSSSASDLGVWLRIYTGRDSVTQYKGGQASLLLCPAHVAEPVSELSSGRAGTRLLPYLLSSLCFVDQDRQTESGP